MQLKCLETNKICPANNLKCKECKLTDCKQALKLIEEEEKMWFQTKEEIFEEQLEKEYPQCAECSLLEKTDINNKKVYCPYMLERCVIK